MALGFIYTSPTGQRDVTVMKPRAVSISYLCVPCVASRLSLKITLDPSKRVCARSFARCGPHVSERATGSWPEVSVMSPCRGNLF